jgi:hypothetical protein
MNVQRTGSVPAVFNHAVIEAAGKDCIILKAKTPPTKVIIGEVSFEVNAIPFRTFSDQLPMDIPAVTTHVKKLGSGQDSQGIPTVCAEMAPSRMKAPAISIISLTFLLRRLFENLFMFNLTPLYIRKTQAGKI